MAEYTKLPSLTWNVYVSDFNRKIITTHNIFNHGGFVEDCQKAYKKLKKDNDVNAFFDEIRKSLLYWYWSKCEWEIIIDHWPHRESAKDEKVDVYDQVMLNWPVFCEYIWANKDAFKKKRVRNSVKIVKGEQHEPDDAHV